MQFFLILFFGLISFSLGNVIYSDEYYDQIRYSDETDSNTSTEIEERVTGGSEMKMTDLIKFNYQVGMFIESLNGKISSCGGVLVHKQVVLTAAHCLPNVKCVYLFMGTILKPQSLKAQGNIEVQASNIHVHENYKDSTLENDIATILLKPNDVTLSNYIGIIPIASSTWTTCEEGEGWVSGWGRTNTDVTFTPQIINYVKVKPLKVAECHKRYYKYGGIFKGQICTSGEGSKGTCEGDSGGPYVLEDNKGGRYLCGLNSFGYDDECANDEPRGKTDVAYYYDNKWICNNSNRLVGC